jgi:hypothetical protein
MIRSRRGSARGVQGIGAVLIFLAAAAVVSCDTGRRTGRDVERCESICDELVVVCEFGAYPDVSSCQDGCLYEDDQGGDLRGLEDCLADSDCDTFEVIECQRAHGWE